MLFEIELEDPLENVGVKLVRQAGAKTNILADAGSSTSVILAHGLIKEGTKVIAAGMNPIQITRGIEKTSKTLVSKFSLMFREVIKSSDPAWFYLHVTCQTAAYRVGVAGWGTGLKFGSDSAGVTYSTHRAFRITLFYLGTLQRTRSNTADAMKLQLFLMIDFLYYKLVIHKVLNCDRGDRYNNWKHAYTGIIATLGGIAILLEAYTWIIVLKRKKSENKFSQGMNGRTNGVNGYGSRPQQV
ncbi:hypothetical protein TSUD_353900 [Trifolium subterraneum]|uniref:Uncharacterized protein n=1 Tax=Trifolium subterraneum TaxID=3900 RepID=A0A2Z6M4R6_TRISU|nr:hypothetical protein TSUD_353900 [Trifolium subterraneum]